MQTIAPVAGVVAAGEVNLLAIASAERLANYPNTPTVSETIPGFTSSGWSILVAPQGTPAAIVEKINADLRAALTRPEVIKKSRGTWKLHAAHEPTGTCRFRPQ